MPLNFLQRLFASATPEGDPELVHEVEAVLDELRPMFALDGGGVELVGVEADRVRLRLTGACTHCSMTATTLGAVEPELRRRLPWMRVLQVR